MEEISSKRKCCTRRVKIVISVLLGVPFVSLLILVAVCLGNAFNAQKPNWLPITDEEDIHLLPNDEQSRNERITRFQGGLRFPTISTSAEEEAKTDDLERLISYIIQSFPKVHGASERIQFWRLGSESPGYSLLYKIKGDDTRLPPYLLMAHMDVVPVEESLWDFDPFGAVIDDGFIYARGTIDDKNNVFAILEALEYVLIQERRIERTFYVAFGHDEEVGGGKGNKIVSEFLRQDCEVTQLDFILDEGLFIIEKLLPGVSGPVALIGVTEKGSATVDLIVDGMDAGHSSNPPRESTIDILASGITRLRSRPHPLSFDSSSPEYQMLEILAPYPVSSKSSFMFKTVYSNMWLFSGIVASQMSEKRVTDAALRTTTAFTLINGGIKVNVMPSTASATVNHRVHYRQSIEDVVDHDRQAIQDNRIKVVLRNGSYPAHPVSPYGANSGPYRMIAKSILQIYPDVPIGPATLIANTDTRWYLDFTKNIYRFSAIKMDENETSRFHGHNERISVENYLNLINFYYRLMKNCDVDPARKSRFTLQQLIFGESLSYLEKDSVAEEMKIIELKTNAKFKFTPLLSHRDRPDIMICSISSDLSESSVNLAKEELRLLLECRCSEIESSDLRQVEFTMNADDYHYLTHNCEELLYPEVKNYYKMFVIVPPKEFIQGVSQFSVKGDKESKLRFAFRIYDLDNDGYISNIELYTVLKMMVGNNLKEAQLQQIVDKTILFHDKDVDGKISFEEFCAIVGNMDVHTKMVVDV
ncbi:unnamed protein product [Notodromas monacha]|uniref:EF-hand domain-containing protein n=1 Tax=Notodromas monacha TaxID=399045 RepID=A0A7R9BE87_9CRUS|nr:unnamed protein product [Notodromas monacha]CAG0912841.1 unnamed protein product [Notodromas monacha]